MSDEKPLGFLTLNPTASDDGYLGAILILDSTGCPKEFRATYPVKPTLIQRTLYGNALERYIGVELCAKPLLKNISHTIQLLVVNQEFLLDVRMNVDFPVVLIRKVGEAIEVSSTENTEIGRKIRIDSTSGRFQPVQISTFRDSSDELDQVKPLVEKLYSDIDLLEPFERIERALKALATQDKRFQ